MRGEMITVQIAVAEEPSKVVECLWEPEESLYGGIRLKLASDLDQENDPINWFAKEILRNPERLDDLKSQLMNRLDGRRTRATVVPDTNDPEDLWDNVPV